MSRTQQFDQALFIPTIDDGEIVRRIEAKHGGHVDKAIDVQVEDTRAGDHLNVVMRFEGAMKDYITALHAPSSSCPPST